MAACNPDTDPETGKAGNPYFPELNEPVRYAEVTHEHISGYAEIILKETDAALERIRNVESPGFENVFVAYDNVINELLKANYNCFIQ